MDGKSSHRQILRSSVIIGGASLINVLIGLLRIKVVAVLLGPAGIGLISLLQSLMATSAQVSGLGISSSGTRQIAQARECGDAQGLVDARRSLFLGALFLACMGAMLIWVFREEMAHHILADRSLSALLGWLGIGVALTVIAASQTAFLAGMRMVSDIARVKIITAFLAALLGVSAIWFLGDKGLLPYVLSMPLMGCVVGYFYVRRSPRPEADGTSIRVMASQWKALAGLGVAVMLAGSVEAVGQLLVRTMVQRELGAEDLGMFQAAWTISMTYVGFVLGAMSADYYPRLVEALGERDRAIRLVNEQTEVALLLAGPLLLGLLAWSPWVLHLLYSEEFVPATNVLRWQLLGDVLKVVSWPMGFIIIAAGKGGLFVAKQVLVMGVFLAVTWWTMPQLQIESTGVAFFVMYLVNVSALLVIAGMVLGFRWTPSIKWEAAGLLLCSGLVFALGRYDDVLCAVAGSIITLVFGARSLVRISAMAGLEGPAGRLASRLKQLGARLR